MRRAILLLPLFLTAVAACQTETYPDAPVVTRHATASPSPSASGNPVSDDQDQVVPTHGRYFEFVPAKTGSGRVFFAVYPLDSAQTGVSRPTQVSGTITWTDTATSQSGSAAPLLSPAAAGGDPYFYVFPTVTPGHRYTVTIDVTVDGNAYQGQASYLAS